MKIKRILANAGLMLALTSPALAKTPQPAWLLHYEVTSPTGVVGSAAVVAEYVSKKECLNAAYADLCPADEGADCVPFGEAHVYTCVQGYALSNFPPAPAPDAQ